MEDIEILEERSHGKASEVYRNVRFKHAGKSYDWDIPIVYRRTGLDLSSKQESEIETYLRGVLIVCHPDNWNDFKEEQVSYWAGKNAAITKPFFDVLMKDFTWKSTQSEFPVNNNPARRIQDIKDQGYSIATRTKMWDPKLKKNCTHLMLLPIPRGGATGYETWTPLLKEKIASSLNFIDVFENRRIKKDHFIIDHKFPEIRWDDETRRNDINNLTEEEILRDFQLIDNQRNQQKREVCRSCFQTSQRGSLYGLEFFYSGDKTWDASIPTSGKAAEAGCIGCGWYDIAAWRIALQEVINKEASKEV